MGNDKSVLLSVVIANFNYGRFLECALRSIFNQCGEPERRLGGIVLPVKGKNYFVEVIVCDAGSADNSVEIIERYQDEISWWCSEKDGGQSAAFNKGFAHSHGEWLTWLNADDMYFSGTFRKLAEVVRRNPSAEWITGNDLHFDNNTKEVLFVAWGPHVIPPFFRKNRAQMYPFGPTTFWKRSAYERIGPIDETLHYQMDLDYWARLTMAGIRQFRLNHTCWAFRHHEVAKSTGGRNPEAGWRENKYWKEKTRYAYQNSFKNPWYILWLFFRVLDGSMFVRFWKRWRLIGRKFDEDVCIVR